MSSQGFAIADKTNREHGSDSEDDCENELGISGAYKSSNSCDSFEKLPPRARSARARGLKAPYIRTSLSPDHILRHRRKKRRQALSASVSQCSRTGGEIIEIDSDSEPEPECQQKSSTSLAWTMSSQSNHEPVVRQELARSDIPSAQATLAFHTQDCRAIDIPTNGNDRVRAKSTRRPPWLSVCLSRIRRAFPGIRCEHSISSDGKLEWRLICLLCDPEQPLEIGPGNTLTAFILHVQEAHHVHVDGEDSAGLVMGQSPLDIDMGPLNAAASSSRATDVVTQFLVEQGLSASFAQALRSVGISDHSRMRMLGALPETDLDKLGEKLACEGLDFVACLLVRGGLRRYARAGLR